MVRDLQEQGVETSDAHRGGFGYPLVTLPSLHHDIWHEMQGNQNATRFCMGRCQTNFIHWLFLARDGVGLD